MYYIHTYNLFNMYNYDVQNCNKDLARLTQAAIGRKNQNKI